MRRSIDNLRFYRTLPLTPAGKVDKKALADDAEGMIMSGQGS